MPTKIVIASDLAAANEVQETILTEVARLGYSEAATFAIRLAMEEGLVNAIKHGNGYDPAKNVEIVYDVDPRRVSISIADQGRGFNPNAVPDPTADENLERPCGRGVMLMRAYMDEVAYNENGTRVMMVKHNA